MVRYLFMFGTLVILSGVSGFGALSETYGGSIKLGPDSILFHKEPPYAPIAISVGRLSSEVSTMSISDVELHLDYSLHCFEIYTGEIKAKGPIAQYESAFDFVISSQTRDIDLKAAEDVEIMIDSLNNGAGDWFRVYHDGKFENADLLAQIDELGNLKIRGAVTPNHSFDLAENFLKGEAMAPGDIVRIDPQDSGAVLLATNENKGALVGVVSQSPGLVLGGIGFCSEDLKQGWGEALYNRFLKEKGRLDAEILGKNTELRAVLDALPGGNSGALGRRASTPGLKLTDTERNALNKLDTDALNLFARENLAPIALSGRTPVKAAASNGPIAIGDFLTAGPLPGTAVKATRPCSVIGVALEDLPAGSGKIMCLIQGTWFGGADGNWSRSAGRASDVLSPEEKTTATKFQEKDLQIEALQRRLARLEEIVARLTGP